ncbi:MAG: hypothetical protein NTW19_00675 [Planctomycetota bacterium]|nr:hypothetical protein [Planctomycetota bacterium]
MIDFLFAHMQIDEQWSVRTPRAFTWWPHQLCQRVWADPARDDDGFDLVQVHACTDLALDVEPSESLYLHVAEGNRRLALNAMVYDPEARTISLRSKVLAHQENQFWLQRLMLGAVGLQAALAQTLVNHGIPELLGGRPAISQHPVSGPRLVPDEMTTITRVFIDYGSKPFPFNPGEFELVKTIEPNPSVLTNTDEHGATAEFPYAGEHPVIPGAKMTSLYRAKSQNPHPTLGYGCYITLNLPGTVVNESEQVANQLNLLESSNAVWNHFLGSWTRERLGLCHTIFLPAHSYMAGLAATFLHSMANRSNWTLELDRHGYPAEQTKH